jgi:hypothetical protein
MPDETPSEKAPALPNEVSPLPPVGPDEATPTIDMSEEMRGAFEEVVVDVQAKQETAAKPAPPPPRPIGWMISAGGSWLLVVLFVLFPPPFAHAPASKSFSPPAELRSASLRFGLWLARQRVDAFSRTAARVPGYAGEAGVDDPTILIESTGNRRYTLNGRDGAVRLQLTSEMAADSFLGESITLLRSSPAYQQAGTPGSTTAR